MSDGTGMDTAPPGPSQDDMARANASQRQGNGKLLGARSDRDVSRPPDYVIKRGSSTRDQATGSQP